MPSLEEDKTEKITSSTCNSYQTRGSSRQGNIYGSPPEGDGNVVIIENEYDQNNEGTQLQKTSKRKRQLLFSVKDVQVFMNPSSVSEIIHTKKKNQSIIKKTQSWLQSKKMRRVGRPRSRVKMNKQLIKF